MNQRMSCKMLSGFRYRFCSALALACCWFCGLLLGFSYGQRADPSYFLMMRAAASSRMSIVGLLTTLCLPFLFAAFAVFQMRPHWLLFICYLKAFTFACSGYAITVVFGTAGWLIRALLLFSDCCSVPVLYWFCMRNLQGCGPDTSSDLKICGIILLVVGAIDFCVISPFLAKLIDI